ncbi:hypothetical protein [Flavobacterium sp.]|uniref:hypothetical protein n=1 Tax=Flavobacterium sp. TaxID=239 RepID=UPI001205AA3D|nr:hypothetical protein [Flavobacterium sp.]RZJ73009.1 MAG: hypothetical protein EOO49_05100 [Flavobacterium sp.]
MNLRFLLPMLAISTICLAQDKILTRYNATISAEITGEGTATVNYRKTDVPGNSYVIDKGDIKEIQFGDGRKSEFPTDIFEKLTIAETEARITKIISEKAVDNAKDLTAIKAAFVQGKLVVSGGTVNEGAYDFKDVKSFPPVGKKEGDRANVSVWLMGADKVTSSKFEKRRLILLVQGQDAAFELYNLMKHLNNALKAQK